MSLGKQLCYLHFLDTRISRDCSSAPRQGINLDGSRILPLGTTKMWGGGALLTSPRDNTREGVVGDPIAPWRGHCWRWVGGLRMAGERQGQTELRAAWPTGSPPIDLLVRQVCHIVLAAECYLVRIVEGSEPVPLISCKAGIITT
jgi:hypothetical protein